MGRWRHSICEACWINREGSWRRDELLDADVLTSVRRPVLIRYPADETPPVERCCFCGAPTIVGIYVRSDPAGMEWCKEGETHDDG